MTDRHTETHRETRKEIKRETVSERCRRRDVKEIDRKHMKRDDRITERKLCRRRREEPTDCRTE